MHLTPAHRRGPPTAARRDQEFADGTVLVKEVFGYDNERMTTDNARWAKGCEGIRRPDKRLSKVSYPHNLLLSGDRIGLGTI